MVLNVFSYLMISYINFSLDRSMTHYWNIYSQLRSENKVASHKQVSAVY